MMMLLKYKVPGEAGRQFDPEESYDLPPVSVPETDQPTGNEREIKKKKPRKRNANRASEQNNLDLSPVDSAVLSALPDDISASAVQDASGSWPVVSDWRENESFQPPSPNNLLFVGLDVKEDSGSHISVISSHSNEGLCSHVAEESASANLLAASTEVTASDNILHEREEQAGSDFLEWAEETKDRSQSVSVPFAECASETAAGSLAGSQGKLPVLVFGPNLVNDKEIRTVSAASMDSDSGAGQSTTSLAKRDEGDPGNPSDAAWMPEARVAQTNSSGLEPLQQSEQLHDRRETYVIPLPKSKGGDKIVTQETSCSAEFLEVGHEEVAVMKLCGQNTDGTDSLVMEKESLIPNYPTTGGSDTEEYGAVAAGLSFVAFAENGDRCNKDEATSKVGAACQVFLEKNKEQITPCPVIPNLPVNTSDPSLIPVAQEDDRSSQSENEGPDKAMSKEPITLSVAAKENHCTGFLVTSEPSRVFFWPEECDEKKASQHTAEPAGSNKVMKPECESGETLTELDPENLAYIIKEDSKTDQRFSPEGRKTDFTGESKLPEIIKKENTVPEENKDISLGGVRSQESSVLTSLVMPEAVNSFQKTKLIADNNKSQDSADVNWGDHLTSLLNNLKSDASDKALEKNFSSKYNLNVPEVHSPGLSQGSKMEKTATYEKQGNSSFLPAEALHLQGAKHTESCDFLNLSPENSLPACKMAEKVCLADMNGSLLVQSENNTIKQNKCDSSWEHPTVKKAAWETESKAMHELSSDGSPALEGKISTLEHQDLHELTEIAECVTLENTKIQEDTSPIESKKQTDSSDIGNVSVPVAELSTVVDIQKSHEMGQEEYRTKLKSQENDTVLAQEPESKLDSPQQRQQEQAAEEKDQCTKEGRSGHPLLAASIKETGLQQLKLISEDLYERSMRELDCPPKGTDSEMFLEALQSKDVRHTAVVSIPSPQAEQEESLESLSSVCSNQQHISSSGLKNDSSNTVTDLDEQELEKVCPKKEHSLELNECSDTLQQCENEMKVVVDIPAQPQTVLCDLETKAKAYLPNISKALQDLVQDSSLQTLTYLKDRKSCLSQETLGKFEQDDSSTLTSDSVPEKAKLDGTCASESVMNEQLGVSCRTAGDSDKINIGFAACLPAAAQNTDIANAMPQILPPDSADADSDRNRPEHNLLSNQTESAEGLSDTEIKHNLSLVDAIILNNDNGKMSLKKDVTFTADEIAGIQERHPVVLPEHTEMSSSITLDKTDSVQKTEFLPGGSEAEVTVLPTSAFSCEQHVVSQQPAGSLNDGIVGELQKQELEIAACQNIFSAGPDLHIAAAAEAIQEGDNSAEKSSTDPRNSGAPNLDSIPSEEAPEQVSQSDESTMTLQHATEAGQLEGSLSPFNFEKLQTEISAIRMKGAKSDVSFKAQQCDSSVESLFNFSSLEERLLSLSSLGKQAGSNEGTAANITCADDKQRKGVENTQNEEKGRCDSTENFATPKTEAVFPTDPDAPTSRALGTGFFDFREHISKIFEKTVQSSLRAEVQHLLDENVVSHNDSRVVKEIPEFKPVLEARDGSTRNGEPECDQKMGGHMLALKAKTSRGATQEKIAQEKNQLLTNTQDSLEDCLFGEKFLVKERCLSDTSSLATLPNVHREKDGSKMNNNKMKIEESECDSPVSNDNGDNLVNMETGKLQVANCGAGTENLLSSLDSNLPVMTAVSSEVVPKSNFVSTTEAGDLISVCNAEPGLSEEEPIIEHYENICHHLILSKDEEKEESIVNSGNVSPLPFLLDVLCDHKVQPEQFSTFPGENEKKSISCNLLDENLHQDKESTMLDVLGNAKHLQLSQEQGQGTEIQHLVDYLKNEVCFDEFFPGDCKPEPCSVNKECGEEAKDTMLNAIEGHIFVDAPKKGITEMLFTDSDSALQPSICDQESDAEKHSETIHSVEQNVCFKSMDAIVPSANQHGEKNWTQESSVENIQGKRSAASSTQLKQNLPSEHPSMTTEGFPAESTIPELCHSLLAAPEKDAIKVAAKDTSDEARDATRVESLEVKCWEPSH
uniref:Uncharacterized protein n=1 Tax=Sphaerodactylus townsendi TaxID=933632 RepID=A0ACB8F8Z6_9SAUR